LKIKVYSKGIYRIVVGKYLREQETEVYLYNPKGMDEWLFRAKNEKYALEIIASLTFFKNEFIRKIFDSKKYLETQFVHELENVEDWQLQVWKFVAEIMIGFCEEGDRDIILQLPIKDKWEGRLKAIEEERERRCQK